MSIEIQQSDIHINAKGNIVITEGNILPVPHAIKERVKENLNLADNIDNEDNKDAE